MFWLPNTNSFFRKCPHNWWQKKAKQNKHQMPSQNHSKHNFKFASGPESISSAVGSAKLHGSGPIHCHAWARTLRFWFLLPLSLLQSLKLVAAQERIGTSWSSASTNISVFLFSRTSASSVHRLGCFYIFPVLFTGGCIITMCEFINLQHC